jgi:class 3 adenylate cyclase
MRSSSFRTKLLAAIAVVAAAATLAAMLPAQRALQASHERFLHERFHQQAAFARQLQERRIASVAERCRALAGSVRLLAALAEGDIELIYDNARDELRAVLPLPAISADAEPQRARFVRFFAADGHLMQPRATGAAVGAPAGNPAPIIDAVRAAIGSGRSQELGWVAAGDRSDEIYEVVVTEIDDPVRRTRLGALVIGFDAAPTIAAEHPSELDLGLLVGDRLQLTGVADADRAGLAAALAGDAASGTFGGLRRTVHGVPHLVLFEKLNASPSFPPAYRIGLYSLANAIAERRALRERALVLLALTLSGGLLAGAILAHGLSTPIRYLSAATRKIRGGDFAVRVPVRARDELGQLSESFNEMAEGLALKERYRRVLDVVADPQVAEQLVSGDLALGGEVREVSILFCDIRGFTAMTGRLGAEEIVAVLNEHMTALTRVVYQHHGVVDKFVGDLVMAVFGAPKSYGADALDAVRCAQAMIAERARLNETVRHPLAVGISVATGSVVAGCTGSLDRLSYTVLGTPVNLVSRLCGVARAMEIVIDEATYGRVRDVVTVEAVPPVTLKGFEGPVPAFRIVQRARETVGA